MSSSRREFLRQSGLIVVGLGAGTAFGRSSMEQTTQKYADLPDFPEKTPQLPRDVVKKWVIACHSRADYVKEMLAEHPSLLNASWDWGSGDWENGLEAAGHMGNSEIASILLSHGARQNVFCAAMMGNLDFVKAALTADPAILHSKGPHGLDLLHHAKAGKENSTAVLAYVEGLLSNG